MKPQALEALEKSISHWEKNAAGNFDGLGMTNCALCHVFYSKGCRGCPVMDKTNLNCCDGTPYEKARIASGKHGNDSSQFKNAAQKELDFLKSLLPKSLNTPAVRGGE